MKITLINCPMWATREPPIRVAQVASSLISKGFDTCCFDVNNYLYKQCSDDNKNLWAWEQVVFWGKQDNIKEYFKENKEQIDFCIKQIVTSCPDVICFWLMTSSYVSTMVFLKIFAKQIQNHYNFIRLHRNFKFNDRLFSSMWFFFFQKRTYIFNPNIR